MKINLSQKLFFGAALLVGVSLLLSIYISGRKSSQALEKSTAEMLVMSSTQLSEFIVSMIDQQVIHMESLSHTDMVRDLFKTYYSDGISDEVRGAVNPKLFKHLKTMGNDINGLWIADEKGILFTGVLKDGRTDPYNYSDNSDRDYMQEAMRTKRTAVSDAILSRSTKEPIFVICTPVIDDSGEVLGFCGSSIRLDFLSHIVTNQKIGETGYGYMINQKGIIIAHPDMSVVFQKNLLEDKDMLSIAQSMVNGENGYQNYKFRGIKRLAAYNSVGFKGWSIALSQDEDEFKAASRSIQNLLIFLFFVVLAITLAVTYFFSRGLTSPIRRIVNGLKSTSVELRSGSSSIAAAGQTLASNSSEQAASLEETAASLEEITSMTNRNSESAAEADRLVDRSSQGFTLADDSIKQLSAAIEEIYSASEETRKIIKTIDEIAFQTNILALNAAVEAARAGDAGAGFAVVADEVRSLAHRSAEAAGRTATIIGETIDRVEHGQKLSSSTLESFEQVRSDSTELGNIVREIAAASKEQADGLSQINIALSHMDGAVQTNAASAEESASAAQELDAQAGGLMDFVSQLNELIEGHAGVIERRHDVFGSSQTHHEKKHTEINPHEGGGFLSD